MGRNNIRGKKQYGERSIHPFLGVMQVLNTNAYLIGVIIFQPAGKEIGFICLESKQSVVLINLQAQRRVFKIPEIMGWVFIDLQGVSHGGVHMQRKICLLYTSPS